MHTVQMLGNSVLRSSYLDSNYVKLCEWQNKLQWHIRGKLKKFNADKVRKKIFFSSISFVFIKTLVYVMMKVNPNFSRLTCMAVLSGTVVLVSTEKL